MRADELMIGDWVLNGCGNLMQVTAISKDGIDGVCEGGEWCDLYDDIKPIPLTPEILKKNGWDWGLTSDEEDMVSLFEGAYEGAYDEHWVYDEGAGEISLIFPEDTDGGMLKIDDQRFNRLLNFLWNDTLYVHELQHALRLCGLDELAGNFKV